MKPRVGVVKALRQVLVESDDWTYFIIVKTLHCLPERASSLLLIGTNEALYMDGKMFYSTSSHFDLIL